MVESLIEAIPVGTKIQRRVIPSDGSEILHISEHFFDTIQGENITGVPSAFLRLQGCTLSCVWCDTADVWRRGNVYSVNEIVSLWEQSGLAVKLDSGQHLVLSGGSPLRQQRALIALIEEYISRGHPKPFIEVENECTIDPSNEFSLFVDIWNNSPKLHNSGMLKKARYKPDLVRKLSDFKNSYFKFVICNEDDWLEIQRDYLDTGLLKKSQIVLMPQGETRKQLSANYGLVMKICVRENVRMTDRLHITIWDKKTGV